MEALKEKKVLVSGAGFAGLSTAYWMNKLGYKVTVVEIANGLKMGGTPVNVEGNTINIVKHMGLFEQIRLNRLVMEMLEFKNADDVTEGAMTLKKEGEELPDDAYEIERNTLLNMLFDTVKNDVIFIFNNSITALNETKDHIEATFKDGSQQAFDLVFGCDGIHSAIRKIWFGNEAEYSHFLGQYFSITIVNKLLIKENTTQFYNVPDKAVMLNAYNNKTDIIFCFRSEKEIPYDYRDEEQQRKIILEQFAGQSWRTPALLEEVERSKTFYFDKLCQIKMPSWTKGRVALVGDAGYCASPAAGKGGSLAIDGAAALADAFHQNNGNFELAFLDYNKNFRPFIEEVQAKVVSVGLDILVPATEEAIRKRNTEGFGPDF
ncbi:FAD-dependent monooxygenase [Chitinophaga sp. GbtcB8]|uniref:FAD-dependent monooxygenase n=1 Tax=Chitinophaga sp. GbtcB8 TaxID=2824753 RepID=UPI001C2FE0A2|nr:FAD-dependent monooxygenase [Chitinophaga sp. GbtcB8]